MLRMLVVPILLVAAVQVQLCAHPPLIAVPRGPADDSTGPVPSEQRSHWWGRGGHISAVFLLFFVFLYLLFGFGFVRDLF